jgi:hypothetical protein
MVLAGIGIDYQEKSSKCTGTVPLEIHGIVLLLVWDRKAAYLFDRLVVV